MFKLFDKIVKFIRQTKINKYYFAVIVFVILTFFLGDSTLQKRYAYDREINNLENEIEYYKKEKLGNEEKLNALKSDDESLEKFAREQFQMTKPGEELFIIKP